MTTTKTAAPTPPTFRIQTDEPTQPLVTTRPVIIGRRSDGSEVPASIGRDAALPAGEAPAYSSRTVPFAQVAESWSDRIVAEQLIDLQIRHYRTPTRSAPEMLLRTFIDPRFGVRALRAVVSGRHSGIHFDDMALIAALQKTVAGSAPAYCSRTIDATSGYAVLEQRGDARASLHWSNSETGCASLEFGAGCYITALDAVVRNGVTVRTDTGTIEQTSVRVTSAADRSRRAHTLPRKDRTEAERSRIAQARMAADIAKATEASRALCLGWEVALQTFAAGWDRVGTTYSRSMAAIVILDLVEEHTPRGKFTDRLALEKVLTDSDRLFALPFGSAAHIAGAYAVLASTQTDIDEARRLQDEAGRWVTEGFGDAGQRIVPAKPSLDDTLAAAMNH